MNTKKFSDAMDELDIKYVDEALSYKKKAKKRGWIKWGVVAACLCLIAGIAITRPPLLKPQESGGTGADEPASATDVVAESGFLMITAYAASRDEGLTTDLPSDEEVIMQEGIEVPVNYNWNPAMSSRPGIPLELSVPEHPGIIFEVSISGGELLLADEIIQGTFYTVENNTTVFWTSMTRGEDGDSKRYTGREVYINIVIREEKNIVGYAVVKIYKDGTEETYSSQTYYSKLLKSVSFPKVNGQYQKVTEEYAASEMEQVKNGTQD